MSDANKRLFGFGLRPRDPAAPEARIDGVPLRLTAELPRIESTPAFSSSVFASSEPRTETPNPSRKAEPEFSDLLEEIGQRNEQLRNQFHFMETSFEQLDRFRHVFHETIAPITSVLTEIEKLKVKNQEYLSQIGGLTAKLGELHSKHTDLSNEHASLLRDSQTLINENIELQKSVSFYEAGRQDLNLTINERTARIGKLEIEIEDQRRLLDAQAAENGSLRGVLQLKDRDIEDLERARAELQSRLDFSLEDNRVLRGKVEDWSAQLAKATRKASEFEERYDLLAKRTSELEKALASESSSATQLRNQLQNEDASHRAAVSALDTTVAVLTARSESADRMLAEARQHLRDRTSQIQTLESKALEAEIQTKALERRLDETTRDMAGLKVKLSEVESSRAAMVERAQALLSVNKVKDNNIRAAEQKIEALEARIASADQAMREYSEKSESRIKKLEERAASESMARALAEGALVSSRKENGSLLREILALKGASGRAEASAIVADMIDGPANDTAAETRKVS